jgi:CubicO group peptidase (beta-lactamase class C family)
VAYGIARGNETLLLGAAGLADKERGTSATTRTPYSLASVTKPMTTTAVMLLAQRGLIDLHAPMDAYLGEAKLDGKAGDPREATVWRVADHSAGLPLHYQFYYADEPFVRPPFEETIRRYGKLFTAPGRRHHYSNLGYGLLDDAIARVSGRSFAEFMAEEVFGPLGMAHASIDAPAGGGEAVAYGPDGVGYPHYDFDHPGGSAAYASVEDLLAFGRFHLGHGPDLLSAEARTSMHRTTIALDDTRGYGFGWGTNTDRLGVSIVQHTGGMGGVNTILRLVPALDLAIAIVVNGQSDLPFRGADDALAALDPAFGARLLADRETEKPEIETAPLPDELRGEWRGAIETYQGSRPLSLNVCGGFYAIARLGETECVIDELHMRNGRLLGVFDGDVQTDDASRRPYRIHLDLGIESGRLFGAAVALTQFTNGGGGAPGARLGNALAYWTDLRRA